MNYHSDEWIMAGVQRHYNEVLKHYRTEQIVFMFYTGSANYNADYEDSDIDTWAVVIEDNYDESKYEVSSIRLGNEIIFFCDIRAYLNGIYYSDWTYLPGLYTKYSIINLHYKDLIESLIKLREKFAYNNVAKSVKNIVSHLRFHQEIFLLSASEPREYSKQLYYCFLILMHINVYRYHCPYESQFYNDNYGNNLIEIKKQTFTHPQCRRMFRMIKREINNFRPMDIDYPKFEELLPLIQNTKVKILERYNNGYSDKN